MRREISLSRVGVAYVFTRYLVYAGRKIRKEAWMREFGKMYLTEKVQTTVQNANRATHNDVESKQKTNMIQIYTLGV